MNHMKIDIDIIFSFDSRRIWEHFENVWSAEVRGDMFCIDLRLIKDDHIILETHKFPLSEIHEIKEYRDLGPDPERKKDSEQSTKLRL